jgi:hypothetical protein
VKRDANKQLYGPLKSKTPETAIRTFLLAELGSVGPMIIDLITKKVLEICESFFISKDRLKVGQMLWCAVDKNDPPARGKDMAHTKLKSVILTVVDPEDIARAMDGEAIRFINRRKLVRACDEANEQGGVLAGTDLALIFGYSSVHTSNLVADEEKKLDRIVPRRGNIHDLGCTLTHKRIICYKHFVEHKQTPDVARATFHSSRAVDRYLKDFARVRHCYVLKGMESEEVAHATGLSWKLTKEYIKLIHEFGLETPPEGLSATANLTPTIHSSDN